MTTESALIDLTTQVTTAVGLMTTQRTTVGAIVDANLALMRIPLMQIVTASIQTQTIVINRGAI